MAEQREATLDELLSEPIIMSVMARYGVRDADIRQLVRNVSAREEQARRTRGFETNRPRPTAIGEIGLAF